MPSEGSNTSRIIPLQLAWLIRVRLRVCTVGLRRFLVAGNDSAADVATGGCGRAATERIIPTHTRATVLTDLRDHAVLLVKLWERHGLGRRREGQGKSNSDQSDHFMSNSALDQIG